VKTSSNRISQFFKFRRAYRELAMLSDSSLKDIGLARAEIRRAVYGQR